MSVPLTVTGVIYNYPQNFDTNWGVDATGWAQAVTSGMLQKSGGSFPLTAAVDFGSSFGIKVLSLTSETANPATSGYVRLAKTDTIDFRNNANSANLPLAINGSDVLTFNGVPLATAGGGTVVSGTAGNLALYPTSTTTVSDTYVQNTQNITLGIASQPTRSTPLTYTLPNPGDAVSSALIGLVPAGSSGALPYYTGSGNLLAVSTSDLSWNAGSSRLTAKNLNVNVQLELFNSNAMLWSPASGGGILNLKLPNTLTTSDTIQWPTTSGTTDTLALLGVSQTFTGTDTFNSLVLGGNENANSHKITGLAQGTTSGDAVSYRQGGQAIDGSSANSGGGPGTIAQGTISTPDLRANAASISASSASGTTSTTGFTTLTSVVITSIGYPIFLRGALSVGFGGSAATYDAQAIIYRSGQTVSVVGGVDVNIGTSTGQISPTEAFSLNISCTENPGAGTWTYILAYKGLTSPITSMGSPYSLIAMELRS